MRCVDGSEDDAEDVETEAGDRGDGKIGRVFVGIEVEVGDDLGDGNSVACQAESAVFISIACI